MIHIDRRHFLSLAAATAGGLVSQSYAWGQGYPARPVRMIVPFAPGGIDVVARLIAQPLSQQLGQDVVVENVGGAGGTIGTARVAQSAPDGHTILFTAPAFVINPVLRGKAPYDPQKDFVAVTSPVTTSLVLLINPSLPAQSVKELVALVKANPGKHGFASAGVGTPPHMTGELFRLSLGLDLVHVPYNSGSQAIGAVVGGQTPMYFAAVAPAVAQVKGGKLRALAVASQARLQALPDVPTMAEAGFAGIEGEVWCAILVPAGTPREIVARLHREIAAAVMLPDIKERLTAMGYTPVGNAPDAFASQIGAEIAKWTRVVKQAGIKVQ